MPQLYEIEEFILILDENLLQSIQIHRIIDFLDFDIAVGVGEGVQEIHEFFVVDFYHGACDGAVVEVPFEDLFPT